MRKETNLGYNAYDLFEASERDDPFGDTLVTKTDVARWLGITPKSVRQWEVAECYTRQGRTGLFGPEDRKAVQRVMRLRARGWSLANIARNRLGSVSIEQADKEARELVTAHYEYITAAYNGMLAAQGEPIE